MKFDMDLYKKLLADDRKETQRMIKDGTLTEEDADLRDLMRQEEILDLFED